MTISVLMYHSLYDNEIEFNEIPEEDRPYAISLDVFKQQLNLLVKNNILVLNPFDFFDEIKNKKHSVLLTFDDGHKSFYEYVYPELLNHGFTGIFFVTSDLIENRQDFCSWHQLKEMAKSGMSIQSHGKTHKFISELPEQEAILELYDSKCTIEEKIDENVTSISFPGGRYTSREIENAFNMGYKVLFTSEEGLNNYNSCKNTIIVKRLALRNTTILSEFLSLASGNYFTIKRRVFIHAAKKIVKQLVGNNFYHIIYRRFRKS